MDTLDTTALTAPGEALKAKTKKVFVKTFGCQMNVYDSERIVEQLGQSGYAETAEMADADLVVLNTCHIREKATEKVYSDLGRIRHVKEARREAGLDTVVTVAGCVAQAEGAEIAARAPVVDLVVGPQSYHRLPDLLARTGASKRAIVDTAFPDDDKFQHLPQRTPARSPTAFLTVQEGCDKFCTFCVVPYTRGMEYSRPIATLETEARRLVERGAVELTLLGQNVNAYHGEGPDGGAWPLAKLIARLAKIDGLERIRYTTSHPRDMADDLIAAHGSEPKLMPFLHLPVQAGADRILAAMNRKHTSDDYRRTIERLRKARPDIALTTDIIVGFPGETDGEFQATLDLVAEIGFAQAYSFKFSGRPGTPAAKLTDIVPPAVQNERLYRLQELLDRQALAFNTSFVGKTLPVLFDKPGRQPGHLMGRTPYLQLVHAKADAALLGSIASVEIGAAGANSLNGVISAA